MNPFAVHVERTADPAEMKWVMHWPELRAAPDGRRVPSPTSALGALLGRGLVRGVRVGAGDLLVRADDWSTLTATVHEAVVADRQRAEPWWFEMSAPVTVRASTRRGT